MSLGAPPPTEPLDGEYHAAMDADPADFAPHAALPPLERTDPGRKRTAYIPERKPLIPQRGTSDALRDLAEADLRARAALPRPPAGYHWMPHIEPSPADIDLAQRYGAAVAHEGVSARLVYRLVRDDR